MPPSGSRNRIIGLVAQNENDALAVVSGSIGHLLSTAGYVWQIINLLAPEGLQELSAALGKDDIAFAFGFAGVGSQLSKDGANLWTALQVPFVAFWYDHPAHNYRQHMVPSPYILNCYHVRDHYEARLKYLPLNNAAILLPPVGGLNPFARSSPWVQRERTFLFVKTACEPELISRKWQTCSPLLRHVLETLAEQALRNGDLDLADAAAVAFAEAGHPISDFDNFFGVIQEIDNYVRAWRSDRLARALLSYPSRIVGRGWDYLAQQPGHAEFIPPFPAHELIWRFVNQRLIANSSPLWRDGIHERVVHGIAAGAVTLTDRTEKADRIFGDLPNYIAFDWNSGLHEAIALAWERAGLDKADYLAAGEQRIREHLVYDRRNFIEPLETAIGAMLDRAAALPEELAVPELAKAVSK